MQKVKRNLWGGGGVNQTLKISARVPEFVEFVFNNSSDHFAISLECQFSLEFSEQRAEN